MTDRAVLADTLRSKGFQMVKQLKATSNCSIFCVQEKEDPNAESFVAKVVSLTGLDAKGRACAQQEVSLLKGLAVHPNLIAYKDSFLENGAGILFIVMSLAEDGDLRSAVQHSTAAQQAIPEPIVLTWTQQTLAGLTHLHSQGVIHRDLKSSNIFLCEGRRRIRIGDFGISRVLESTAFASSCVGTPAYMSPEQMRNERYEYHVDMWALGCIVYEVCTLTLPFTARSLLDLVFQVVETEPDWDRWTGYTDDIRSVSWRLLQKDVTHRPTAACLLEEPLFANGCDANEIPAELWAVFAVTTGLDHTKRHPHDLTPSQLTTAGGSLSSNGGASSGRSGTWLETPPMSGESSGSAGDASTGYGSGYSLPGDDDPQFTRAQFQTLLSTFSRESMKEQMQAASASLAAVQESRQSVYVSEL